MQFLLIVIYVLLAGTVTVHVLLTKSDVRAALGWIAVAWLSPVFGAVLYFVFGINRVTRRALDFAKLEHERGSATGPDAWPPVPPNIAALSAIAQRVTGSPLIAGNAVSVLRGGDEAYPSMLAAIRNARHSVALGSYIFRDDSVGRSFIGALIDAHKRGVEVRCANRRNRQRLYSVITATRSGSRRDPHRSFPPYLGALAHAFPQYAQP
jgi:cardiolipin synthase